MRIEPAPAGAPSWHLHYANGDVDTQLVLNPDQHWQQTSRSNDKGAVVARMTDIIGKILRAGLQPWWVTRRLKWHADALAGAQPYRARETAPRFGKFLKDTAVVRSALEGALEAIERQTWFKIQFHQLATSLESAVGDLRAQEAQLMSTASRTPGEFLRGLSDRCDLTLDELVLIMKSHPDELATLRGKPRGRKDAGDIRAWLKTCMGRERASGRRNRRR